MLQDLPRWVTAQLADAAGLHIRGQADLQPDSAFGQVIHQVGIFYRPDAVPDSFGTKIFDCSPDALRPIRFPGVYSCSQACPTRSLEMRNKQCRRETLFITGKIQRGQSLAMCQQCIQFRRAHLRPVATAENANQAGSDPGSSSTGPGAIDNSCNHFSRVKLVPLRHEPGAEAQFNVINTLQQRIFDIFAGYSLAGISIRQNCGEVTEFGNELHQPGLSANDLHMWPEFLHGVRRQCNAMLIRQFKDGLYAQTAVEVTMQVTQRKAGVNERCASHVRTILVARGKQVKQRIYSYPVSASGYEQQMNTDDSPSSLATDRATQESAGDFVQKLISDPQHPLVMFGIDYCEFSWAARRLLDTLEVKYKMVDLGAEEFQAGNRSREIRHALQALTGSPTTPQVFIAGTWVGGATDLFDEYKEGSFQKLLQAAGMSFTSPPDLDPYSLLQHHHFKL